MAALTPLYLLTAFTTATAAISVHLEASCGKNGGFKTTENQSPHANGENQPRESLPLPPRCSSLTTTSPLSQPSSARRLATLLV